MSEAADPRSDAELEAAGWTILPTRVFSASIGTTWVKGEPGERRVAFLPDERVQNDHMGNIHGGALMTFADLALGFAAVDAIGEPKLATAQLQYCFVAGAKTGRLVICEPEVVRKTSQLVFVRGLFKSDGKVIGSADAIFKNFAGQGSFSGASPEGGGDQARRVGGLNVEGAE